MTPQSRPPNHRPKPSDDDDRRQTEDRRRRAEQQQQPPHPKAFLGVLQIRSGPTHIRKRGRPRRCEGFDLLQSIKATRTPPRCVGQSKGGGWPKPAQTQSASAPPSLCCPDPRRPLAVVEAAVEARRRKRGGHNFPLSGFRGRLEGSCCRFWQRGDPAPDGLAVVGYSGTCGCGYEAATTQRGPHDESERAQAWMIDDSFYRGDPTDSHSTRSKGCKASSVWD